MDDILIQNARAYASRYRLRLAERLGFGIHGIIFVAEGNPESGNTAVKAHRFVEPYFRERSVYQRLKDANVIKILGFNVPQLVRFDDGARIIEMSIVERPFVLDFAGAWLEAPPDFPEELWAEWEAEKQEQFESRWPTFTWWTCLQVTSHFLSDWFLTLGLGFRSFQDSFHGRGTTALPQIYG